MNPLNLGRQSAVGRDPHMGVTRLVNVRAEEPDAEGEPWKLVAVSGLASFATVSGGPASRMIATHGGLVVRSGRAIAAVDTLGGVTVLGGFASDGLTTMARNSRADGEQIAICCDGSMVLVQNNVLSTVTDPDVGVPNSVFEISGYFVTTEPGGKSRASELLDGSSWDGLSVERIGRHLTVGAARGRDAVFFGPVQTHIWSLNDGADYPLSPRSSIGFGVWAGGSVVSANDTIYWLSTTDQGAYAGVRVLVGDQAQLVPASYADRLIARETSGAITGTTWTEDGRTYIAWSGATWTVVLDTKTGLWHERGSLADGRLSRWRVGHTIGLGSRVIAADYATGALYELSYAHHDEAGNELVTLLQTPPLTAYPGQVEVNELHVDVVPGVGLPTGAGHDVDPQIAMTFSRDGRTWATQRMRSLGRQGDTARRVRFGRLGTSGTHGVTIQLRSSAAVVRGYKSAWWDGKVISP